MSTRQSRYGVHLYTDAERASTKVGCALGKAKEIDLLNERADKPAFPNDVLWEWRFAFESHWSRHAASALNALSTLHFVHYTTAIPESFGPWIGAGAT